MNALSIPKLKNRETVNPASWKRFLFHLRREFLLQLDGRRSYSRGVYPGVSWFAILCVAVLLMEFNASRLSPEQSSTAMFHFRLLALGQSILIGLRSTVYCALSFSRDLKNHTVSVVRTTPVSGTQTLLAKLCACLAPLWIELVLFLPVSILFFSVYLSLPVLLVASLTPLLGCLSLAAGSIGLTVGTLCSQPVQAMRNARIFAFFIFFFVPLLQSMSSSWTLPFFGLSLWIIIASRRAPNRGVVATTFLFVLTALGLLELFQPLDLSIHKLNPMNLLIAYLPDELYSPVWGSPPMSLEHFSYPISVSVVYLLLAIIFFALARTRFNYAD